MARVVVAMSGGVDSSVAAWLLRHQGYEVIGLFMRHGVASDASCETAVGDRTSRRQGCCTAADAADARRVADLLDVPFYALNFEEEFRRIIDYFVDEYSAGRTPNPCIVCNTWLKFGRLFEYADSVGAQYVATGHHARLVRTGDPDLPALCRGRDPNKDQSYVLFGIDRRLLGRLLLPVGEHQKDEIVTTDGTVVGRHDGLEQFTVGQRKGLGIAFGQRRFVIRLEPETRRVVVGTKAELARTELTASGANWLIEKPGSPIRCQVKIRYRSRAQAATVEPLAEERFRVRFDEPLEGVAPGQAAVCYNGDRVLGGGWIE